MSQKFESVSVENSKTSSKEDMQPSHTRRWWIANREKPPRFERCLTAAISLIHGQQFPWPLKPALYKDLFLTDIALDDVSCRLWQRESPEVARRKSQSTAYKQMEYAVLWRAFPASNFRIHCICMYVYIGVRRPLACPTSPCMSLMGTVWVKSTSLSVFSKRSLTHPVSEWQGF